MKTVHRLFIVLGLMACFTACKKNEAEPEMSARIAGEYTLTYIKENGTLYKPNTATKGTMKVTAESATTVQLIINVSNGNASQDIKGTVTGLTLTDVGNGELEMKKDGNVLGRGGNNQLTVKIAPTGGTPYEIIGAK